MKYFFKKGLFLLPALMLLLTACEEDLDVVNPNEPTLDVLDTEDGIKRAMLGMYNTFDGGFVWVVNAHHECMGDALYIPWGNFSWRWANQPTSITLDDGTVVTPPQGGTQAQELVLRNDRAQGDNNAFIWEWAYMYRLNNISNLLISKLDEGTIELSGDAATKEATVRAFAHFWKGFTYSRIGSMYSAGIITDVFGETNPNFVTRQALIDEANNQLDLAIDQLGRVGDEAVYAEFLSAGIPDFMRPDGVPTTDEFVRNINTLKARNILVNTKVADMTDQQWAQIESLASNGLQQGDNYLQFRTADENSNFRTGFNPYRVLIGWHFPSERLIQDFKDGDERFARNFALLATPQVNRAGRGIQYGTRYGFATIDEGGDYATLTSGLAVLDVAGSWEEASLMEAEALINQGSVEDGLALIDAVRTAQNSGLPAVTGTGLDQATAIDELYLERRIGLFLRGLPFYDARRFGVIDPISEGGGREGAVVLDANGVLNTNATFDYNYLNYWGVPDDELDFNLPAMGSASVEPE
ncbi:MAG: RagB/SusD family nutrient uptake outer membrane protein [Bacteroidota bacterium]